METVIWGVGVGLGIGIVNLVSHRYLQQDLFHLSVHVLANSASTYLAVALAGWAAAIVLRFAARPLIMRSGRFLHDLSGLAVFLCCSLPVWVWPVFHDRWLFPRNRMLVYAGFAMVVLAHVLFYYLLARRLSRRDDLRRHPRRMGVIAVTGFLVTAGLVLADWLGTHPQAPAQGRPNILIIVMDTVRADRLSCYGYERPTTCQIDSFASEGIRFTNCYSTSSWTVPSHASLFTGLYAVRHRATQEKIELKNQFATLAEILANNGYQTWGASGNPLVGQYTNMSQGFREFVDTWRQSRQVSSGKTKDHPANVAFRRFLKRCDRRRPFFAFINYIEAHWPYMPPQPFRDYFLTPDVDLLAALKLGRRSLQGSYLSGGFSEEEVRILSDLYDAEVAYVSSIIGKLIKDLQHDGRYDETLIILVSDHGEHFGEHALVGHVFGLYNTTVKVPLIIRMPGGVHRGRINDAGVQLVDLFPTVLNASGVDYSAVTHHGSDLLDANTLFHRDEVFSEYYFPLDVLSAFNPERLEEHGARLIPYLRRLRAYQKDGYRLIWSSDGRHEFYDLLSDPRETRNLYDPEAPSPAALRYLGQLKRTVDRYAEGIPMAPPPDWHTYVSAAETTSDAEVLEALRTLGYAE